MTAVIQAAKESAHVFPLAALRQFAEKPHRGHHAPSSTFRPGATIAISNTVTGIAGCLYDSALGLVVPGRERDSETGLDYFMARSFSGSQGRFTVPDPNGAGASLFDPQSWNGYSYVLNRPFTHIDENGDVPILAITAGVGAVGGAIVGGGAEAFAQYARNGRITSWGKIGTAAGGGFVAGGLAGLTLGVGAAAGVATTAAEVIVANTSSSVLGGIVQRSADEAFGLEQPSDGLSELGSISLDAATGGWGIHGGKLADKYFPIPNVQRQTRELAFAHRRHTRQARINTVRAVAESRAYLNSGVGAVTGGLRSEGIKFVWQWFTNPPPVQAQTKPTGKAKDYEVTETITSFT